LPYSHEEIVKNRIFELSLEHTYLQFEIHVRHCEANRARILADNYVLKNNFIDHVPFPCTAMHRSTIY